MKKILYVTIMSMCLFGVSAQENEEIKLSGFYLGGGVNVNYDMAKVYNRDAWALNNGSTVPAGSKIGRQTDLSYGIHALLGYGHLFANRIFLGIEQQVGVAHHPSQSKNYIAEGKVDGQSFKPWEFTTLARLGYGFESFPGIAYVSAGVKVLKINSSYDDKNICRPVFGIGYQHGLSPHWSIRGDVLYTHISKVDFAEKMNGMQFNQKGKGHRISAMVTIAYTF